MCVRAKHMVLVLLCVMVASGVKADDRPYLCEIGAQGGIGYYAGDATEHIFQHVRETFGGHFRYKFDERWALQVKGLYHRIQGNVPQNVQQKLIEEGKYYEGDGVMPTKWVTKMVNVDVMGEFNFVRLGLDSYDRRVKCYSPYIFLGIGMSLYGNKYRKVAAYFPVGIGFKWKFAPQWGLNVAWQHNIYFADDLEQIEGLGNTYKMNGSNIMNCDVTSQLTLGIVFEFGKAKKICRHCEM